MIKKIAIIACIILAVVSLAGCPKKDNALNPAAVVDTVKPGKPFGYVLLDTLSLWNYDETKEAAKQWEWVTSMALGKKVEILDTEPMKIKKGEYEYEWLKVSYAGKTGLAMRLYIGTFDIVAVVTAESAMRFKSPEITGVIAGKALPRGTMVSIPSEDLNSDYVRAHAVLSDGSSSVFTEIFLKKADISTQEADVQAFVLYMIAKNMSDPKAKDDPKRMENLVKAKTEILKEALSKYAYSAFAQIIQTEIDALAGISVSTVGDNSVEVYESPDANSTLLGTLDPGVQLKITEKSEVDGIEWVRISDPYNGWILASGVSQ